MASRDERLDRWIEVPECERQVSKWKPTRLEIEEKPEPVRLNQPYRPYRGKASLEADLVRVFILWRPLGEGNYSGVNFSVGRALASDEIRYIVDRTSECERRLYSSDEAGQRLLSWFPRERRKASPPRRIDLVVKKDSAVWLLEAKADPSKLEEAIGQVLEDRELFQREYGSRKPIRLGIICEESSRAIEETCRKLGITIFERGTVGFRIIE